MSNQSRLDIYAEVSNGALLDSVTIPSRGPKRCSGRLPKSPFRPQEARFLSDLTVRADINKAPLPVLC